MAEGKCVDARVMVVEIDVDPAATRLAVVDQRIAIVELLLARLDARGAVSEERVACVEEVVVLTDALLARASEGKAGALPVLEKPRTTSEIQR